jgi:hypothetical protein
MGQGGGDVAVVTDCITLAREHFQYCTDVLDLDPGDIAGLAAALGLSDWWSFWWD